MEALFPDVKEMEWAPLMYLFVSYGYILYRASGLISDGAELLMLVLSPGLVGGLILPVMGAVPDGAIMLFSGIGPDAQDQLSVGVGTLAGSTVMLLTLPWAACAVVGRVDLNADGSAALYKRGLTDAGRASWLAFFTRTGIQTSNVVNPAAGIMLLTSLTYLVMQGPAWAQTQYLDVNAATPQEIAAEAAAVNRFALAGFVLAFFFFLAFSYYSVRSSLQEEAQARVIREARKRAVAQGLVGLTQLIMLEKSVAREEEEALAAAASGASASSLGAALGAAFSGSTFGGGRHALCTNTALIKALFDKYDTDHSGSLDVSEVRAMLAELKLPLPASYVKDLVREVGGEDHLVQLDEFQQLLDTCMDKMQAGGKGGAAEAAAAAAAPGASRRSGAAATSTAAEPLIASYAAAEAARMAEEAAATLQGIKGGSGEEEEEEGEEEEGEEEENANLTPAEIRRKAFGTLALGVAMVTVFSDPMVNVLSQIAVKTSIPPFYVGFVIAPIISNASEIISSISQAQKKRKANIDVTYSQLLGAATMNNTFCLCIFMLIVYIKGLYWEFSAEILAILIVEAIMAALVLTQKNNTMPVWKGLLAGLLFPGAIGLVYLLENKFGMN